MPVGRRRPALGPLLMLITALLTSCSQSAHPLEATSRRGSPPGPSPRNIRSARLPRCAPDQYRFNATINGAAGAIIIAAEAAYVKGPACRLVEPVTITLEGAAGHLLRVQHDPFRTVVIANLDPKFSENVTGGLLAWHNWCASSPSSFLVSVTSQSGKAAKVRWANSTPICASSTRASSLDVFTEAG